MSSCAKVQFESDSQLARSKRLLKCGCAKVQFESDSQPNPDNQKARAGCAKVQFESDSQHEAANTHGLEGCAKVQFSSRLFILKCVHVFASLGRKRFTTMKINYHTLFLLC